MYKYSKYLLYRTAKYQQVHFNVSLETSNILIQQIFIHPMSNQAGNDGHKRPEHVELTSEQKRQNDMYDANIVRIQNLSPTIKGFTLQIKSTSNEMPTFMAGQWVDFFIPGLDKIGGYSMCSEPSLFEKEGELELAVKFSSWAPAHWLHTKANVGSNVAFRVGGNFHYPNQITNSVQTTNNNTHDLLLVAGGVGINPLASIFLNAYEMKRSASEQNKVPSLRQVNLLYSSKTKEELIFRDKIETVISCTSLQKDYRIKDKNQFNAKYFVTRQGDENLNDVSTKHKRIDVDELKAAVCTDADRDGDEKRPKIPLYCYLCGPPEMIKQIANILISVLNVPEKHVFYEMWW